MLTVLILFSTNQRSHDSYSPLHSSLTPPFVFSTSSTDSTWNPRLHSPHLTLVPATRGLHKMAARWIRAAAARCLHGSGCTAAAWIHAATAEARRLRGACTAVAAQWRRESMLQQRGGCTTPDGVDAASARRWRGGFLRSQDSRLVILSP
jgi:hypothetical protein